ncbi:hypothetical protein CBS101457_000724 [Exobasidium rhododendri]|nr:hypothetical protein CBS101457_000724 [Exobasidium rhododendri]
MAHCDAARRGGGGGGGGGGSSSISQNGFRPAKLTKVQSLTGSIPMDLISSPSRGIDSSDQKQDLTNHDTQSRYRAYISERLQAHRDKFGALQSSDDVKDLFPVILPMASVPAKWRALGLDTARLGSLQDILLLVRRLREGCVAAARQDAFAVDVYALSTALSMLIGDDVQLSSSLPRLMGLFAKAPENACEATKLDLQVLLGTTSSDQVEFDQAHSASIYLLWLSVSGGHVARIGGAEKEARRSGGVWLQERERIMRQLSMEEQDSRWIKVADEIHGALVDNNAIRFRMQLIEGRCSIWQRAIVRRGVEMMREVVWSTLTKAYMHVPLDTQLVGGKSGGDDWLERMLFVDLRSMPPPPPKEMPARDIPDSWDDSVDQLTSALNSSSLQDQSTLIHVRASRLASIFEHFRLSESIKVTTANDPLSRWSGRQVLQGGGPQLKLR